EPVRTTAIAWRVPTFPDKNGVFGARHIVLPQGEGLQRNLVLWRFIGNRCSIRTVSRRPSFLRRRRAHAKRTRRDYDHPGTILTFAKNGAWLGRVKVICFLVNRTKKRRGKEHCENEEHSCLFH